ncbi:amidohydrolase [Eubacteriales bacterium DFI.9.88]|nr:amidohydrolase [Eubacteriales bacterium DFI.9.88]
METKKTICDWIDENKDEVFAISDYLWEHPELSMQEYEASQKVADLLEKYGFLVNRGVAGLPTAFAAEYGSGKPVLAFSSEYDALPALSQNKDSVVRDPVIDMAPGHGCGHNLMAVGGVLAAIALQRCMIEQGLAGTIKVFGTPAEELCIGKPFMARGGLFEGVDAFLDWHPSHRNRAAACDTNAYFNVKYHFSGVSAHGNAPWNGRSSLDGAMLMGHAVEMLREHIEPGSKDSPTTLNYAFPDVGNSFPNVVPANTVIWCVGRMKNAEMAADVLSRLDACAKGCAQATGTTVKEEVITATHDMIPNLCLGQLIEENLRYVGAPAYSSEDQEDAKKIQKAMNAKETGYSGKIEHTVLSSQPVTDSSEYSWFAPIAFLNVALAPSEDAGWHSWTSCKFAGSSVGKRVLETAGKILALAGYDLLTKPEILQEAKAELKERLCGKPYQSLLPENAKPDLTTNKAVMERFR